MASRVENSLPEQTLESRESFLLVARRLLRVLR
jgi:hypothetical protein